MKCTTMTALLAVLTSLWGFGPNLSAQTFSYYPAPVPYGIATGPDGALWFTEFDPNFGDKIGRMSTEGVVTNEYSVASYGLDQPDGITAGPDGALWFTASCTGCGNGGMIGRITTSGSISAYTIPSASVYPPGAHHITAGPDGALWFTESSGNNIGRIATVGAGCSLATPCFSEYPVPTAGSFPSGITQGPDGALWFTEATMCCERSSDMVIPNPLATVSTV